MSDKDNTQFVVGDIVVRPVGVGRHERRYVVVRITPSGSQMILRPVEGEGLSPVRVHRCGNGTYWGGNKNSMVRNQVVHAV